MADELIIEPREEEYLAYQEKAIKRYDDFNESLTINPDISMATARNYGVTNEWESYRFFANEELNAPKQVFNYIDDKGKEAFFTVKQIDSIRQWEPGTAKPIENIHGHHVETIRENPTDTILASDPDNILLATTEGHREFLHGGDTKNPTQQEYLQYAHTNDEKLQMTLEYNEKLITLNFWEAGATSMASSAIVYLAINEIIDLYRLKKDPRPWSTKKYDAILSAKVNGMIGLGLGAISYSSKELLTFSLTNLSLMGISDLLIEMSILNGTFFIMSIAMATIQFIKSRKNGLAIEEARKQYKDAIVTATAELVAFSVIGIGIDIGLDVLGGLVLDALIPDPTGILIALRFGYSALKMGKKFHVSKQEQQAYLLCNNLRQNHVYQLALKQF